MEDGSGPRRVGCQGFDLGFELADLNSLCAVWCQPFAVPGPRSALINWLPLLCVGAVHVNVDLNSLCAVWCQLVAVTGPRTALINLLLLLCVVLVIVDPNSLCAVWCQPFAFPGPRSALIYQLLLLCACPCECCTLLEHPATAQLRCYHPV